MPQPLPYNIDSPLEQEENQDYFAHKVAVRNQRLAIGALAGISLFIVLLAAYQFRSALSSPIPGSWLAPDEPTRQEAEQLLADYYKELDKTDVNKLKTMDTDGDGLTDFDETYVYLTNPYLADSDSDGMSDQEELKQRSDPNCPKGVKCFSPGSPEADSAPFVPGSDSTVASGGDGTAPAGAKYDPLKIRALLLGGGIVTKEQLAKLSDAEVLAAFEQSMEQAPAADRAQVEKLLSSIGGGTPSSTVASASNGLPLPDITPAALEDKSKFAAELGAQATPAMVRQMLAAQGMPEAVLKQLDDATLMSLMDQALAKYSTGEPIK